MPSPIQPKPKRRKEQGLRRLVKIKDKKQDKAPDDSSESIL